MIDHEESPNTDSSEATKPAPASLRKRAIRGSIWWTLVFPIHKSITLITSVILARLLSPEIFGIMALVDVILRGIKMFTETGIRTSIVQNKRSDPDFLNTAWTIQAARGLGIWIVASLLAWPMARFYDQPLLVAVIPFAAFSSVLEGFRSTSLLTLNRHLHEAPRAIISTIDTVLTRITMVIVALVWPSVWALPIGGLTGNLFVLIASYFIIPGYRNCLRWEREAAHSLIHFGKWVFLGTILVFFSGSIDKLLMGKLPLEQLDTIAVLGVYAIANRFASIPSDLITGGIGNVLLPAMSETARNDSLQFGQRLQRIRKPILWVTLTGCLGVVIVAPALFEYFFDERYSAAQWMTPILAFTVWFQIMTQITASAIMALGHPKPLAFSSGITLVASVIASLIGFYLFQLPGFIIGLTFGAAVTHIYTLNILYTKGINLFRQDAAMTGLFISLVLMCYGSYWLGSNTEVVTVSILLEWVIPLVLLLSVSSYAGWQAWKILSNK